jgi:hypothetical protein
MRSGIADLGGCGSARGRQSEWYKNIDRRLTENLRKQAELGFGNAESKRRLVLWRVLRLISAASSAPTAGFEGFAWPMSGAKA